MSFNGAMKKISILLVSVLLIQFANAALMDDIQLHAPFDGNADDASGNGNDGTVSGAVLTADRDGNADSAYHFDGVDDYIDFGTSELGLTGGTEMTASVWVRITPTSYHNTILTADTYYRPYAIKASGTGSNPTVECIINTLSGGAYVSDVTGSVTSGNWHHIACTYDGTDAAIYVDGEFRQSISLSGTLRTTDQSIYAGANPYPTHFYNGDIDDIRIWSRALSEEEIAELYEGVLTCVDVDGDGWNSTAECNEPMVADCLDVDPLVDYHSPLVNPGMTETNDLCSNGYDEDCVDGDLICDDCPLDEYDPITQRCLCESSPVEVGYCCEDGLYSLIPCEERDDCIDKDGDGWNTTAECNYNGLADCADNNPLLFPGNINNYCDCDDTDGFGMGKVEVCGNAIDEDCDGADLECTNDIYVGGYQVNHDFEGITDECLDLLRTKVIFFGSRSIGLATRAGLWNLAEEDPKYELTIETYQLHAGETIPDDAFDSPKLAHFIYKIFPIDGRWTTFDEYSRAYHDKIDVAFEYVYSSYAGGPEALFNDFTPVFDALVEDLPDIQYVIATHTLDTRTTPEGRFNFEGKWYTEQIKEKYTGVVPIFDLGDIESTRADDSICQFEYDGTIYRRMCPEYNTMGDYIHPNSEEAVNRLGKGIFILLSKILCEDPCVQDSDCDDGLACNGQEACVDAACVPGTPVDCSADDIPAIAACDNDPDANPLTWDSRPEFVSQCLEPGTCTAGDPTITSTCSLTQCGAQCDAGNSCQATDCDALDECVGDDYHDYDDVGNSCQGDCSCEDNPCGTPTIYPDALQCTGCETAAECDDGQYCNGVEQCVDYVCQAGTPVTCDDGISCTADSCDEVTDDCSFAPDDNLCYPLPGECTSCSCDPLAGCVYFPSGCDAPDETLQLHAPFDGNADDASGKGNDGTVNGAVLTADRDGNADSAYHFDGVEDYIDFGTSELGLTGGTEMTASVWVKPDTPTNFHSTVLSPYGYYRPFVLKTIGTGSSLTVQCAIFTLDGGSYIYGDNGGITVGNWHHIACTYDGATASVYVDGELKNSVSVIGTLRTTTSQHNLAGANPMIPPIHFYNGDIDDIRIWSRALSAEEIAELQ